MKCLSIQQPWASLICGGIKDVENRSWRVNEAPGRILIHSGKTMRTHLDDLPVYFLMLIDNAVVSGYVPEERDLPKGAIIGYADVVGFTEDLTSDWAQTGPGAEWKWQIENPKLFKEPIPYLGRQGLFDVPEIDESNLPETVDFPEIARDGTRLTLPVSNEIFASLDNTEGVYLYLTEKNRIFFTDENLEPLPTEEVEFINSSTGAKRCVAVNGLQIFEECDQENNPITFPDPDGNELSLFTVVIPLNEL